MTTLEQQLVVWKARAEKLKADVKRFPKNPWFGKQLEECEELIADAEQHIAERKKLKEYEAAEKAGIKREG